MRTRAVALYSGGLDSILAVRLLQEQNIEILALHNRLDVHSEKIPNDEESEVERSARKLGVSLEIIYDPEGFLEVLKHPRHGYGKNLNPCIDCRIYLLRKAAEYMRKTDAQFIVTGEALGERPMSQSRNAMILIEKEAGLERMIIRPLSAKLMEITIPEERGLVDREKLLAIQGRSRKPQIELARKFGITEYPSPAGGCLLTDPGYARRLADMMRHQPDFESNDLNLLKVGRHFRLSPKSRFVVGRNHDENMAIIKMALPGDVLIRALNFTGPITLYSGGNNEEMLRFAASVTAGYGRGRNESEVEAALAYVDDAGGFDFESSSMLVKPAAPEDIEAKRI